MSYVNVPRFSPRAKLLEEASWKGRAGFFSVPATQPPFSSTISIIVEISLRAV
jgi:hypothetical protein